MQKVKMGLIGLGGMGQAHMNKIKEIPEAELTAVSDVDSQITKKISQEHKVPGFTDYEELLEDLKKTSQEKKVKKIKRIIDPHHLK